MVHEQLHDLVSCREEVVPVDADVHVRVRRDVLSALAHAVNEARDNLTAERFRTSVSKS